MQPLLIRDVATRIPSYLRKRIGWPTASPTRNYG